MSVGFSALFPKELQRCQAHSIAAACLFSMRLAPRRTWLLGGELMRDCFLQVVKVRDSILELCFQPGSRDPMPLDPRKAVLFQFTIHFASPLAVVFGSNAVRP
jgi:hypothetical protein